MATAEACDGRSGGSSSGNRETAGISNSSVATEKVTPTTHKLVVNRSGGPAREVRVGNDLIKTGDRMA